MRLPLFLLALFTFFSCKKDNVSKSFVGEWQLKEAYGFGYHDEFPPNSGNKIIISSDKFQEFWQDTLKNSGPYRIVLVNKSSPLEYQRQICVNQDTTGPYISREEKTLTLIYTGREADILKYELK